MMLSIAYSLVAAACEIFLIWLIWPTATYRAARKWVKASRVKEYKKWLLYPHVKRQISARTIAMNAIDNCLFSSDDLVHLNELFGKLGQPAAEAILPDAGAKFDETTMSDLKDPAPGHRRNQCYVLETKVLGVKWRGEVLKKAEVVACTPDHLMIHRLANSEITEPMIVQAFLDHLLQNNEPTVHFELQPSVLHGFIQAKMLEKNAAGLFENLIARHPESDFSIIHPKENDKYNADTMTPSGGQIAGQKCRIVEVIHPGLIRKHAKGWRIKALVKIENQSRDQN